MNLRKCPACKNMISRETDSCPICGCEPGKRRLRQIITWSLLLGCGAWATEHYVSKRMHAQRGVRGHQPGETEGGATTVLVMEDR